MWENYHIGTTLTKNEWIDVLQDKQITNKFDVSILQTLYSFHDYKTSASQIGFVLGFKGKYSSSPLNLEIGRWGKRVIKKYPIKFTKRDDGTERKWDIFFDGWQEDRFIWQLKKELKEAIETLSMTGIEQMPEELPFDTQEKMIEGANKTIIVNSYERNSKARLLCVKNYGVKCQVCSFDFENTYGEIGKDFIHVHHLTSIAEIGQEYEIDPVRDLRPVCPNCHSMLHRKENVLTIEELKAEFEMRRQIKEQTPNR